MLDNLKSKFKIAWLWIIAVLLLSLVGIAYLVLLAISQTNDRDSFLVCGAEAKWYDCKQATGHMEYDPMDGRFYVTVLNVPGQPSLTFDRKCSIKPEGSSCMDSTSGKNETGFDNIIIPLAPRHFW